jgi:tetratricopeptide (TPR) repeat protein
MLPIAALALACAKDDSGPKTPISSTPTASAATGEATPSKNPLPEAARPFLDSANASFRAKKYDESLAQYRKAIAAAPKHPAPWYGVYMVAQKLNNTALADSAFKAVTMYSTDGPSLTDTSLAKLHEKAGGMPGGHPPIGSHPSMSGHPEVPPGAMVGPVKPGLAKKI